MDKITKIPSVLMMQRDANNVSEVIEYFLKVYNKEYYESDNISSKDKLKIAEDAIFYNEEFNVIILELMFSSNTEKLQEMLNELRNIICNTNDDNLKGYGKELFDKIYAYCSLTETMLRGDNITRYLGEFIGRNRTAWQELLLYLSGKYRPVNITDIYIDNYDRMSMVDFEYINKFLKRMIELTLISSAEIEHNGLKDIYYEITFIGRIVSNYIRNNNDEDLV